MTRTNAAYDVFLSFHEDDRVAVEALATRLLRENITPWLDSWHLIPGQPRQEAIEVALDSAASCAVFIGPSGTGPWQQEEMRAAIDRRVTDGWRSFRVIPVLLPGAERGERSRLPAFLAANTWVEFRVTLDDEPSFRRLIAGIRGVEPGATIQGDTFEGATPYRGLQTFNTEDAPFFYGREVLVDWLVNTLQPTRGSRPGNRFLGVIGPSGSGKSSLARAGLVAALKGGAISGSDTWAIATCTPTADPIESLAVSLLSCAGAQASLGALRELMRELSDSLQTLHQWVRLHLNGAPPSKRVFLLVDQFEELFTLCADEQKRQAIIENLLYAATVTGGQTIVVLTVRADFYGRCAAYASLAAALSDYQMLVGPMSEVELRRAIERPAHLVGCEFEPGLVETLLREVKGQPGTLPLLQHALLELWQRRQGRRLTHAAYQAIGGVVGAIERHADAVFNGLDPIEQDICRRVFLRLTQPGEGTEDTRRRAPLSELVTSANERAAVERVVTALADTRLITTSRDNKSGEQLVDVSHEALISGWPRLQNWIAEDRAGLIVHRRLTSAAIEWQRLNYDEDLLYRGLRLAQVLEWQRRGRATLNELERHFVETSDSVQQRQQRNAQQRQSELARRLIAGARAQASTDPELSVLLAAEAVRAVQSPEADDALRAALQALQRPRVFAGHIGPVVHVAVSPDSGLIVSASWDSTGRIWAIDQGVAAAVLSGYRDVERGASFAHFSVEHTRQADQLDFSMEGHGHTGPLTGCWFSPTGSHVLTTSRDCTGCIWRVHSGPGDAAILQGHRGRVLAGAFSPDGQYAVTAGADAVARLWHMDERTPAGELRGHTGPVLHVAYSPDGRFVVTGSADGTARLWDVAIGACVGELRGHTGPVQCVAVHPGGRFLVTASADGTARQWDLRLQTTTAQLLGHKGALKHVALSDNAGLIATSSDDGTVRVWHPDSGLSIVELSGHSRPASHCAFHPNGRFIATAGHDGAARLWAISSGQLIGVLSGHDGRVNHLAFSPNGLFLVTAGQDGKLLLHDCSVCNIIDLFPLVQERVGRDLTADERERYFV